MTTIRVIVIDPFTRTVSEGTLTSKGDSFLHALYESVGCATIGRTSVGGGIDGWIDDEGLLRDWDTQAFFTLTDANGEPSNPFAGRMVLACHTPDGELAPLHPAITVPAVYAIVQWIAPQAVRVPAPTFQEMDDKMNPVGEPVPLSHSREWTYDNQP